MLRRIVIVFESKLVSFKFFRKFSIDVANIFFFYLYESSLSLAIILLMSLKVIVLKKKISHYWLVICDGKRQ
jgi:hypothetical protein